MAMYFWIRTYGVALNAEYPASTVGVLKYKSVDDFKPDLYSGDSVTFAVHLQSATLNDR